MISKRSNTASAKGRDALCVPVQKVKDMEEVSDNGRVASDRALVSDQAASRLDAPRFDPSRDEIADEAAKLGALYRRIQNIEWACKDLHCTFPHDGNCWCFNTALAQHVAEATSSIRAEMDRRDQNETRNCINWGPCSRHDNRMCDSDGSPEGGDGEAGSVHDSAGPAGIAQGNAA